LGEKCVTLEVERASQRGRHRKTWKEVVDKITNDLHRKLSDAIDSTCSLVLWWKLMAWTA